MNLDSAEYANIVLTFTRFYDQARRAGMAAAVRLRAEPHAPVGHARRLGLLDARRLHELGLRPRLPALAPGQEARADAGGAVGLASSDSLLPGKQWGQWSKSMLDNGFDFYERLASRAPERPRRPGALRRATRSRRAPSSAYLAAARIEANAARAIDAGLGSQGLEHAAAALQLRPRHRPPRRDHAHLQHRGRRGQPERLPVRRPRPRAPVRRPAGGRGEHRRPPAGVLRPARPRRRAGAR